jgi:hypothetical protein
MDSGRDEGLNCSTIDVFSHGLARFNSIPGNCSTGEQTVIKFQAIAKGCGFLSTRYYQESNGEYVFEYTFCLRGVSISPWEIVIYPMLEVQE